MEHHPGNGHSGIRFPDAALGQDRRHARKKGGTIIRTSLQDRKPDVIDDKGDYPSHWQLERR